MTEKMLANKELFTPVAIVLGALIIGGAIIYSSGNPGQWQSKNNLATPKGTESSSEEKKPLQIPVSADDHIRGNPNAPVTIVEFSDLECPFCKRFHLTLKQALQEYPDKVRWVYKHFPIDQLHPKARKEAEASECANELGGNTKFWEYLDRVFEITPSNNQLDLVLLPKIAEDIGLNRAQFESCLNSGKFAQRVEEDYQEGVKLGIQGTPGSFVNGIPVPGAVSYERLKATIDAALQ